MYRQQKIALVLTALNEQRLIGAPLEAVPEIIDHVYVVDDASQDQTRQIVLDHARQDPRIQLLVHDKNQGVGQVIITGYSHSSKDEYDITVVAGGDHQMPLDRVEDLLNPIIDGQADYTKGNRFLMPNEGLDDMPLSRFFGNALISILTKMASGYYKIFDVVDGYTAISKRALNLIDWTKAWKGYGYPMDFLVRLNAYGFKVKDVLRRAIYLAGERQSQISSSHYAMTVAPMLVRDFFWRLFTKYLVRDFHPLFFFYLFGLIFLPIGIGFGLFLIYQQWIGVGVSGPRSVVCALMILMGIQFQLFAILYDMQESEKGYLP